MEKTYRFTYYGDLLGISNVYKLDNQTAFLKLNDFYNTTFKIFQRFCKNNPGVNVNMFSDSLLIYGSSGKDIIIHLQLLYFNLIKKGLLLRGAMVEESLEIDPRLTLDNFQKQLPKNDTLARAVGLEKSQEGARFLVESRLVGSLFEEENVREWSTHEGYIMNPKPEKSIYSVCRRISPTPDNSNYEVLYFWIPKGYYATIDTDNNQIQKQMSQVLKMVSPELSKHYKETISLLKRSLERKRHAEREVSTP